MGPYRTAVVTVEGKPIRGRRPSRPRLIVGRPEFLAPLMTPEARRRPLAREVESLDGDTAFAVLDLKADG